MAKMTRQRLEEYFDLKREIENQKERLAKLRSTRESPSSPRIDDMPRSNFAANRIENQTVSIDAMETVLNRDITRAQREALKIERAIQSVPYSRNRELLRLRFLDGLTWAKVADKLDISEKWASILASISIDMIT